MRIFLAGASGVIGQRLIPRLVQAGHVVGGLTRSSSKTELLSHLGAEPILCDVFDREALIQAVRDFKPDVILNELTDLPDDVAQISFLPDEPIGKGFEYAAIGLRLANTLKCCFHFAGPRLSSL
jgi:uncharacterized protein YbjT (DUF2867 family)